MALPAALIRAFGVGKKAWRIYKKHKKEIDTGVITAAALVRKYQTRMPTKAKRKTTRQRVKQKTKRPVRAKIKTKTMAKRKTPRRRAGKSLKTTAKRVLTGVGIASVVGGGLVGGGIGYVIGGAEEAAGAFFAPQIRQLVGNLSGQVSGLGAANGGGLW